MVVLLGTGLARAVPPAITSFEPPDFVQGTVPQPDLVITGTNFVVALGDRPTVTLLQEGVAELSALAFVNLSGTLVTVPSTLLNLLPAPLGAYDVIVTRPDGESHTLPAAFDIISEPESDGTDLKVLSVWGGPINDVEVVGNLAYVAVGRRLVILDLTDPGDPVELGSLTIMPGVEGVAVRDGYAFLGAHQPHRFCVADVSDPSDPTLVSASSVGQTFPNDVSLYGNLAYVRETGGVVEIFDVTDPLNVVNLGSSPVTTATTAAAMTIVGDLLYVAYQIPEGILSIYDLSADPFSPALLGSVDTGGRIARGLVVDGNYAYVAALNDPPAPNSLYIVDVSDPSLPVVVGSDDGFVISEPTDVAVRDGFAYVADSAAPLEWPLSEGLVILDVSNPANPMRVGNFKTHGNIQRIEIIGDRAYLSDDGEGLIILDLTSPTNPVRLGNYHSPAALRQMAKAGDLLFVADTWNGFTVLDVSNPASPDVVGVYLAEHIDFVDPILGVERPLGIDAWGIAVKDDRVYLGAGQLGLEVVDVGDPTNPALLGAFRIPFPAFPIWDGSQVSRFRAVTVSGDVAHIGFRAWECNPVDPLDCNSVGYFLNLDVSQPQSIFELGREPTGVVSASKIEVNGASYAFCARAKDTTSGELGGGQLTIDTFDQQFPETVYWGVDPASDVALVGTTLYITEDNFSGTPEQGLWIQDVTDPVNPDVPVLINETTPLAGGVVLREGFAVAATNRRVYVAGRGTVPGAGGVSALYLLDTSEPTAPVLLDIAQPVGGTRSSLFVHEPTVFVTNVLEEGPNDPSIGLVVLEGMDPADLDGDGTVGISDFLMLLGNWGPCPGPCPPSCLGNLDGDCDVGITDLLALLGNWG